VYGLTKALASLGSDVRVLTTNANGRAILDVGHDENAIESNLRVRYTRRAAFESTAPALLAHLPELVRWADVVHLLGAYNFPTIPTMLACRLLDKPLVWSPRGALQRWAGTRRRRLKASWETVCRTALSSRVVIHTTSDSEATQARERIPARTVVIPNGVEMPADVTHVGGNTLRIAFLGRLDPIKGLENLIEACALVAARGLQFELSIAGAGDSAYEASLRELVARHGLDRRVSFVGEVHEGDKAGFFAKTNVFVLPSHSENFGLVVLEALAHEVPVIASDRTPWSALDREGCGVSTSNQPEPLAAAIQGMQQRDLHVMGKRGRAWVAEKFAWGAVGLQMIGLYEELVEGARSDR
jgi:glycosyltransferase involved in cell wall biosynthesis